MDGDGGGKHRDVSTPPPLLLLLLHRGTLQQVGAGRGGGVSCCGGWMLGDTGCGVSLGSVQRHTTLVRISQNIKYIRQTFFSEAVFSKLNGNVTVTLCFS